MKTIEDSTIIESDFNITEPFDITKPNLIERVGMDENLNGIYTLTYVLKEKTK